MFENPDRVQQRFHVADVNMRGLQQWKTIDESFVNLAKRMTETLAEAGFPNLVVSYHNIAHSVSNPDREIGTWDIVVRDKPV